MSLLFHGQVDLLLGFSRAGSPGFGCFKYFVSFLGLKCTRAGSWLGNSRKTQKQIHLLSVVFQCPSFLP